MFTVKLSLSCFSAVRKVGRTQASSNSWKMGARVSHQDWLPGTLALRQGSRQKLGLFIFPKGLCRPCPTFSSEERAISGVAYCVFYNILGTVSDTPNLFLFLSAFFQHLTCFWELHALIAAAQGLIKMGSFPGSH